MAIVKQLPTTVMMCEGNFCISGPKLNILIHVFCQFISHQHIKSELSFPSQQNPTTVPYNDSYDYSSLSYILFTNNPFNIIPP